MKPKKRKEKNKNSFHFHNFNCKKNPTYTSVKTYFFGRKGALKSGLLGHSEILEGDTVTRQYFLSYSIGQSQRLLTAPNRYILALSLHNNWGHSHRNWDGIKVGRVGRQGEDGCFCRQRPLPFHSYPMKTSCKPHDPHDDLENYVHQSGNKMIHVWGYFFVKL